MIDMSNWYRGPIRHMKRIGQDPSHSLLREINDYRLANLKANRRLTETPEEKAKNVKPLARTVTSGNLLSASGERAYSDSSNCATDWPNPVDLVNSWGRSGFQRG